MQQMIGVFRKGHFAIDVVKVAACAIMFTHGVHRYLYGEIGPLGDVLAQIGFPFAQVQANLVNAAETFGTVLIALGVFVRSLCAVMILIFVTGIVIFHWQAGFFIVGPGEGGWEFSALLICCFAAVALDYWPSRHAD